MKKIALIIALSSILGTGAVQASDDVPATLAITGSVTSASAGCTIGFANPSVQMGERDMGVLPTQGQQTSISGLTTVRADLIGDCTKSGQLSPSITFTGIPDDNEGNALLNSATGSAAATGLGVGIYDLAGEVISPNNGSRKATSADSIVFYVGMVKLKGVTGTPGQVQSSLTVQVDGL